MSLLAQVAVEGAVYHFDQLFTYQVPQSLAVQVRPGVRVMAPFGAGNRERVAMVFAVGEGDPEGLKPLREVLDREPALPPASPPPRSINGVKRRCNAGMGRCQGGFCGPRVQEIIARELGLDQADVLLEQAGSYILTGKTKTGGNGNV